MIHIWTDGAIREADPHTVMRMDGHPRFTQLLVPNDELEGWDTYFIELRGRPTDSPHPQAPVWQLGLIDAPLTLELEFIGAWRPPAPMMALIQWAPGARLRQAIEITVDTDHWSDADLAVAAYALRRLHGVVTHRRGLPDPVAIERAVTLAHEWVEQHDSHTIEDFGRDELAAMRGVGRSTIDKEMTRKSFNEGLIKQRYRQRFGWDSR